MYKSLVRPHFDYCDIIFHIPPSNNGIFEGHRVPNNENHLLNSLLGKIESVQYQAALAITGTWQGTNKSKFYKELGLESLSDHRSSNRVLHICKIINNLTPAYLREKLPPLRIQRNRNDIPYMIHQKRTRTNRYENSFLPNAISSWNNIIGNIRGDITSHRLKSLILKSIRPEPKSIYDIHDPIGLRFLFQLRTGLSPLRSHKFRHGFLDTQTDTCHYHQGIEDIKHFLFECHHFANYRVSLAVDVTNILLRNNHLELVNDVELYLYGNPLISSIENKLILSLTIQYIKNTQRFSH